MGANLRRFYLYRLLATSYLFVPIFMLFQAERGLTFFERLALGGVYSAVLIAVEVPTGVLADRLGRRRAMMLGAVAMIASCLVAATAHGLPAFVIAEVLGALAMALSSGADSAYLYDQLLAAGRAGEYGAREAAASAWHLVGSALAFAGGGLLAEVALVLPYLATAAVAAAALVVAARLDDDRPGPPLGGGARATADAGLGAWARQVVAAVTTVARRPGLAWLVGYSAVVFALLRATVYVYQPYLRDRGLGPGRIGLAFAGAAVVSAVVAWRTDALRRRHGDAPLLWGLLAALAASFVGLAGAGRGPWMLALLVAQAVANGLYSPLTKPLLNREITDSGQRAAVLSVESMARRAAMAVFAPLLGAWGEADAMLPCGVAGLVGLLALLVARGRPGAARGEAAAVPAAVADPR